MAYDEDLANRLRTALSGEKVVEIPSLYAAAQEIGRSPDLGAVIEEAWIDTGRPKSAGCRLWAQAERARAATVRTAAVRRLRIRI